jgi:hypothetical protein
VTRQRLNVEEFGVVLGMGNRHFSSANFQISFATQKPLDQCIAGTLPPTEKILGCKADYSLSSRADVRNAYSVPSPILWV